MWYDMPTVTTEGNMLLHRECLQGFDVPPDVIGVDKALNLIVINQVVYEGRAAAGLEIPTAASTSLNAKTFTLVQDMYRAREVRYEGNRVFVGASVRLAVSVSTADAAGKLTLAAIAANVEAGRMNASYKFELLGVSDHAVFANKLPTTGSYDAESYLQLQAVIDSCQKTLAKLTRNKLDLVELFVVPVSDRVDDIVWAWASALELVASGDDPETARNGDPLRDWVIIEVSESARVQPDDSRKGWALLKLQQLRQQLD